MLHSEWLEMYIWLCEKLGTKHLTEIGEAVQPMIIDMGLLGELKVSGRFKFQANVDE